MVEENLRRHTLKKNIPHHDSSFSDFGSLFLHDAISYEKYFGRCTLSDPQLAAM
jgi:hypothetical protein